MKSLAVLIAVGFIHAHSPIQQGALAGDKVGATLSTLGALAGAEAGFHATAVAGGLVAATQDIQPAYVKR